LGESCQRVKLRLPTTRLVTKPPPLRDQAGTPSTGKAAKARYAKLALNQDGSKVLLVAFEQSAEAAQGYDVLRADTNFNGTLQASEKTEGKFRKQQGFSSSFWPPLHVDVPYSEKAKGVTEPCTVSFYYFKANGQEDFRAMVTVGLRQDSTNWMYSFSGTLKPSDTIKSAPLWRIGSPPTIKVTTKPDPDKTKKGNTGIGIQLVAGQIDIHCSRVVQAKAAPKATGGQAAPALRGLFKSAPKAPEATIVMTSASGKVMHKKTAPLDDFAFG